MKQTLLEITQDILSSLNSDEVNSINDSEEATAVAKIIRECYFDIVSKAGLPIHYTLFELTASSSSTPTVMYLPNGNDGEVYKLQWIKYNQVDTNAGDTAPLFETITPLGLDEFLTRMYSLDLDEDNVTNSTLTIGTHTIDLLHYDDKKPQYWTSFDDNTIIFDSYDADQDTNLQNNKTLCYGWVEPAFSLTDSHTVDLNTKEFNLLKQEVKAQAFIELRQMTNANAERKARKGWITTSKNKFAADPMNYYNKLPNYGRKRP